MLNLLQKLAVQNTGTPSSIAVLTNVMDGIDGAASFGYQPESTSVRIEDDQTLQYKQTHPLDIRVLNEAADKAILDAIVAGTIPALASGYTPDGFLIWDEPSIVSRHTQYDSLVATAFRMSITAPSGYAGTAPVQKLPVYAGRNALGVYNVLAGSANVLNGFSLANDGQGLVSASTQTVEAGLTTTPGTILFQSERVFFPFPGKSVRASMSVVGVSTAKTFEFGIQFLQSDGTTQVSRLSATVGDADAGIRVATASGAIPANTVYMRFYVAADNVDLSDTMSFTRPMIGLNNNMTFEQY